MPSRLKVIIIVLILMIIFAIVGVFYSLKIIKFRKSSENIIFDSDKYNLNNEKQDERINNLTISREEIMEYIADNISELSPEKPVLGGNWHVYEFWFATDYDVYADYEDGHISRRILISVFGNDKNPQYKVQAFFEPGENEWTLKSGEDTIFGKILTLYDKDVKTGKWIKKN